MNITITGDIGSGKSTVAKKLAESLNMKIVEAGELYREYSSKQGRDVLSQNKSDDWSIDKEIDSKIEAIGKDSDNIIFVSRLAWHFVPNAIHIYLTINPVLAAKRVFDSKFRTSEKHSSWEETFKYNKERKELELKRYAQMYGIEDATGYNNSDIIVVVGKNDVDSVADCIINAIKNNEFGLYIDPKVLLPTQSFRDFNMNTLNDYISIYNKPNMGINAVVDLYNNNYYCKDGHHRVLAAIKNELKFIKIPQVEIAKTKPIVCTVFDYEDMAGISLTDEMYLNDNYNDVDSIIDEVLNEMNCHSLNKVEIKSLLPAIELSYEDLKESVRTAVKVIIGI